MTADDRRWNVNIHHHRAVLAAVPPAGERALDIGCGEGILTRQLRARMPDVTGIDRDGPSIALAREQGVDAGLRYVEDDFLTAPLPADSFDLVASVATLHHVDAAAGLRRMRDLLRPGGTLLVVGLARSRHLGDLLLDLIGAVNKCFLRLRYGYWEHSAPMVWPPPESHANMRDIAARLLPGSRYRHGPLLRYTLTWTKPAA